MVAGDSSVLSAVVLQKVESSLITFLLFINCQDINDQFESVDNVFCNVFCCTFQFLQSTLLIWTTQGREQTAMRDQNYVLVHMSLLQQQTIAR